MTDLRTEELDFVIPDSCIATQPATPRDSARLMVVPLDGSAVQHRVVRDLFDNRWLHLIAMDDNGELAWRYDGNLSWSRFDATDTTEQAIAAE